MDQNKKTYPMILSIPKSGTHLIIKLMTLLTDGVQHEWNFGMIGQAKFKHEYTNEDNLIFEEKMIAFNPTNTIIVCHTNISDMYQNYITKNPCQKTILQIRDLRDVLSSLLFIVITGGKKGASQKEILDDRLMKLIKGEIKNTFDTHQCAINMVKFINSNKDNPNIYIAKFENLVGPNGKGNITHQQIEVKNIASFSNIEINDDKINKITTDLFGKIPLQNKDESLAIHDSKINYADIRKLNHTFRKGEIGNWKEYFSKKHLDEFEKRFGHLQIALGYPVKEEYIVP